ncbi:hypothetical protein cyc_03438 [Cyclospora cayetanensis]|uniref:Uncharacterized protein n=1 Tax=Cyclospora cayetanensis TaxID=88456 RepID=A0A1D3D137_9EIME|nr:hypothetical protein cyc_03438 [Cyclospora cayetanensis]
MRSSPPEALQAKEQPLSVAEGRIQLLLLLLEVLVKRVLPSRDEHLRFELLEKAIGCVGKKLPRGKELLELHASDTSAAAAFTDSSIFRGLLPWRAAPDVLGTPSEFPVASASFCSRTPPKQMRATLNFFEELRRIKATLAANRAERRKNRKKTRRGGPEGPLEGGGGVCVILESRGLTLSSLPTGAFSLESSPFCAALKT